MTRGLVKDMVFTQCFIYHSTFITFHPKFLIHKHKQIVSISIHLCSRTLHIYIYIYFPHNLSFEFKQLLSLFKVIFQVMFSIIALDFFKLQPEQNGYLMAYFGIASMVSVVQIEIRDKFIMISVLQVFCTTAQDDIRL